MKARIKDTGEVVDVHWEGELDAWLGKLCSGRFREFKERVLEFLETNNIDWSQRRYEIAKEMLTAFLSNSCSNVYMGNPDEQAKYAVRFADALIAELKKGGQDEQTAE